MILARDMKAGLQKQVYVKKNIEEQNMDITSS